MQVLFITSLQTDWNDGYCLCAVVNSLGADVPGFPNLDRSKKEENCQKGTDIVVDKCVDV